MKRRDFIITGLALGLIPLASGTVLARGPNRYHGGCCLASGQLSRYAGSAMNASTDFRIIQGSGDSRKDRLLGRAMLRASALFGVVPAMAFFDDGAHPNALATSEVLLGKADGTVLLGRNLYNQLTGRYDDGGVAILAVCAHEFAHILQFATGTGEILLRGQQTVKNMELHADYLAGYYLGRLKQDRPFLSLWSAGDTFHKLGDENRWNPNHHGTPAERVAAVEAGYRLANVSSTDIQGASRQGLDWIRQL